MTDQSRLRQSWPSTAVPTVMRGPLRTVHRVDVAGRRCFLGLLVLGLAIEAWALYPSSVQSGNHVALPEASAPAAVKSVRDSVVGKPLELAAADAFRLMDNKLLSIEPAGYGAATVRYSSPMVFLSEVSLRSKLQALLMLLYSQSGAMDPAALEAKLQALLQLPDSVLMQLMAHPDLADFNRMLDEVFLGTSDLSGVETQLHRIDVVTVPGTSEQIRVIKVDGKASYTVHSLAMDNETEPVVVSSVPAPPPPPPPPPDEPAMMAFSLEAPAGPTASAFMLAPNSEQLALPAAAVPLSTPAFAPAPSSEEVTPPPAPSPSEVSSPPSAGPTSTPQTPLDVIDSGNKFEPGDTAAQATTGNSSATQTNSSVTQSATPSTSPTGAESAQSGSGGEASPSNNGSGGSSSESGTSP
jgi:hypothetical protein